MTDDKKPENDKASSTPKLEKGGYQPQAQKDVRKHGYQPTPITEGYQPAQGQLNTTKPPQGGSGVPPKNDEANNGKTKNSGS